MQTLSSGILLDLFFDSGVNITDEIIYIVVREIFENFEQFKSFHPSLSGLTKEGMVKGVLSPVHPGAMQYYTEHGYSINSDKNDSSLLLLLTPVLQESKQS